MTIILAMRKLSFVALLLLLANCAVSSSGDETSPAPPPAPPTFTLSPGDWLVMSVYNNPPDPPAKEPRFELSGVIDETGNITLVSNKVFRAAGNTLDALRDEVRKYYEPRLSTSRVFLLKLDTPSFLVSGEVNSPGLQFMTKPSITVLQAIQLAGGFTRHANRKKVKLVNPDGSSSPW
jgi:protein involved in polysaccharide export with SLBB domain